jgi:hypothetical protein
MLMVLFMLSLSTWRGGIREGCHRLSLALSKPLAERIFSVPDLCQAYRMAVGRVCILGQACGSVEYFFEDQYISRVQILKCST